MALEIGTDVEYYKFHMEGTDILPVREPVRISDAKRRAWTAMVQKFVSENR